MSMRLVGEVNALRVRGQIKRKIKEDLDLNDEEGFVR